MVQPSDFGPNSMSWLYLCVFVKKMQWVAKDSLGQDVTLIEIINSITFHLIRKKFIYLNNNNFKFTRFHFPSDQFSLKYILFHLWIVTSI